MQYVQECIPHYTSAHLHNILPQQSRSSSPNSICHLKAQEFALLSCGSQTGRCLNFVKKCINLPRFLNHTSRHFQFPNQPLFAWIRIVTGTYLKLNYCPQYWFFSVTEMGFCSLRATMRAVASVCFRKPNLLFMHACRIMPEGLFVARSSQYFLRIMLVASVSSEPCKLRDNFTNISFN